MSIASELQVLLDNKAAIKAAIIAKNPYIMPTDVMSQWPEAIASIGRLVPETTGVTLVGSSVQLGSAGILSGFSDNSYASLPYRLPSNAQVIDCVVRFKFNTVDNNPQGIWGNVGSVDGFTPFYQDGDNQPPGYSGSYISTTNGTSWGLMPPQVHWDTSVVKVANVWHVLRVKYEYGIYSWMRVSNGSWVTDMTYSYTAPFSNNNLVPHLGNNRGQNNRLKGEIDLNYCYMYSNGRLLWEGVKGAYYNVEGLIS